MSATADRLAPALETARAWWRWWTAELRGMLPAGLRAGSPVLLATPEAAASGGFRFARLTGGRILPFDQDPAAAGLPVWLALPAGAALRRAIDMPAMPEADLRRALLLDLDRQTPCSADALWFDARVLARDPARGRLRVEFAVAHAAVVEAARGDLAASLGSPPERVTLATPGGPAFALAPAKASGAAPPRTGLLPRSWRGRLLLLCGVLGIVNLGLHLQAEQARRERLDAAVLDARRRAQRVEAIRTQITERRQLHDDLVNKRGNVALLSILDQLTRLLPDEAWLDSVEVRGASVYVTGYAPAAATLVAQIETSPMFADAQFRSPVTPDRARRRERFDMAIRLKGQP